jgi:glycosyltransferase involved in cell wall biosynthesis
VFIGHPADAPGLSKLTRLTVERGVSAGAGAVRGKRAGPLVSVIVPTYNRGSITAQAIESIQAQTHQHTDVIIVDDGSTHEESAKLSQLPGVEYLRQEHQGPAAARTRGLELAQGEFVASLDSDDLWHPPFLERCLHALISFDVDFVFTNWTVESGGSSYFSQWQAEGRLERYCTDRRGDWFVLTASQTRDLFLDTCLAPSSSTVLRRSAMPGSWNGELSVADDWYLMLEMTLSGECRAAFTPTPLWVKRVVGDNRYDGRTLFSVIPRLYFHDYAIFRRDFGHLLSPRERRQWLLRQFGHRAILHAIDGVREKWRPRGAGTSS